MSQREYETLPEAAKETREAAAAKNMFPKPPKSLARRLWWFTLPALAAYAFIVIIPSVQGVYNSFTDWSSLSTVKTFIGLDNYKDIFSDSSSFKSLTTTVIIAIVTSIFLNIFGLALALVLNTKIRGRNSFRALIFAPVVIAPLVCGYLFQYILGPPGVGALNQLLEAIGLGSWQQAWLGQPRTALISVIIVIVWQFTGANMVIYLAALQNVPPELLEASALDGATARQRLWYVIRPFLAPAITINLTLNLIGGLKVFDQVYATTGGGPAGSTDTISTVLVEQFTLIGAFGYAAALATILAIGIGIFSAIQNYFLGKQASA